jgi:hypothetical protein
VSSVVLMVSSSFVSPQPERALRTEVNARSGPCVAQ